jgi:hypothetical protein
LLAAKQVLEYLGGADRFTLTHEGIKLLAQPLNITRRHLNVEARMFSPDLLELLIDLGDRPVSSNPDND